MEALYRKLHDKYTNLKKRKFSELDEIGKDQEVKFLEYVSAAEDMIQHLQSERERLKTEVSNLRSEITSFRSAKDEETAGFQQKLLEMKHEKNLLLEDIERFKQLLNERPSSSVVEIFDGSRLEKSRRNTAEHCDSSSRIMSLKGRRDAFPMTTDVTPASYRKMLVNKNHLIGQEPEGDVKDVEHSGKDSEGENFTSTDHFQELLECLVGMKLSHLNEIDGACISAMHQSSGYSFSLRWIEKETGEEPELLYCVSTLGTFEAVAPEWMRSTLIFGMSMCPLFFKRISRVISLKS